MQSVPIITNVVSLNPAQMRCTRYKVCQCLWFSPGTQVSSTNETECHDIAEILLKVALNTITLTLSHPELILNLYVFIHLFTRVISLTTDKMVPGLAKATERTTILSVILKLIVDIRTLQKINDNFLATRKQSNCYNIKNYVQSCKKT